MFLSVIFLSVPVRQPTRPFVPLPLMQFVHRVSCGSCNLWFRILAAAEGRAVSSVVQKRRFRPQPRTASGQNRSCKAERFGTEKLRDRSLFLTMFLPVLACSSRIQTNRRFPGNCSKALSRNRAFPGKRSKVLKSPPPRCSTSDLRIFDKFPRIRPKMRIVF